MALNSIMETVVTGTVKFAINTTGSLWLGRMMEPNSAACLEYIKQNAQKGDPASVVAAIDTFASNNIMMNVGDVKGAVVDAEIRQKMPRIMAEIGSYTGYSTVRFASVQRETAKAAGVESHYYAFEFSPIYAARVREVVAIAGLEDQVTVIEGAFSDQMHVLKDKPLDMVFIDHDNSLYVSDTKQMIENGFAAPGATLIADNVIVPGAPEYLAFLEEAPYLTSTLHTSTPHIRWLKDGLSISTYTPQTQQ